MILVFAGAGASKAVGPDQYPTTEEFFKRLPKSVTEHPFFETVASFVRQKTQSNTIDIEQWLWAAGEALTVLRALGSTRHAAGWLFDSNRLANLVSQPGDVRPTVAMGNTAIAQLESLEDQVNRQIYQLYGARPSSESLEQNWIPLLRSLSRLSRGLEVFTTNYDIVIEEALRVSRLNIETGRRSNTYSEVDESLWIEADENSDSERRVGLLTKLHGSVDWSRNGEQIYFGTPRFQGDHKSQVIIYPGFKGVPDQRPFTLFHEHLSRVSQHAEAAVFIGFAFRDEYINQVFRDRLAKNALVFIVDPAQRIAHPFSNASRVEHITDGFGSSAVDTLTKLIASRVAV